MVVWIIKRNPHCAVGSRSHTEDHERVWLSEAAESPKYLGNPVRSST